MIDLATADELDRLAARVARIRPISNANPAVFYEERSEVASEMRALAMRMRNRPEAATDGEGAPAAIGRQTVSHEARHIAGRTVLVLTRSAARG